MRTINEALAEAVSRGALTEEEGYIVVFCCSVVHGERLMNNERVLCQASVFQREEGIDVLAVLQHNMTRIAQQHERN